MRNVIQWDLNSFFFQKLTKIAQRLGALPQTPIAIGGWGLCPQTPVSDTFEYTSLLNLSSKLDFYTFQRLVFAPSLYQNQAKCHQATASDLPFYDIFAPQKITFSKISDDVIACDFWFGPPQSKILATPMPSTVDYQLPTAVIHGTKQLSFVQYWKASFALASEKSDNQQMTYRYR